MVSYRMAVQKQCLLLLFNIVLPEPVNISEQNYEQKAVVGETATVQCPLRFGSLQSSYEVTWNENGHRITNGSNGYLILTYPNECLVINEVIQDCRIRIQCEATLFNFSTVRSQVIQLVPCCKLTYNVIMK